MEIIKSIKEVYNFRVEPVTGSNGNNGSRLGILQMVNIVTGGYSEYDGYEINTDENQYYVLINNGQSCCEDWGYLSSDDNLDYFVGAELIEVKLTDVALNQKVVEESNYYDDGGGIQFVDFVTDKGVLQLAVYNAHNGYYGHSILIAKNENILLNDVL